MRMKEKDSKEMEFVGSNPTPGSRNAPLTNVLSRLSDEIAQSFNIGWNECEKL